MVTSPSQFQTNIINNTLGDPGNPSPQGFAAWVGQATNTMSRHTAGWSGYGAMALRQNFRTSQTILRGPWSKTQKIRKGQSVNFGGKQWRRHPFKSTFGYGGYEQWNEESRYLHQYKLFGKGPYSTKGAPGHYSPYQLSGAVNRMGQWAGNTRGVGSFLAKHGVLEETSFVGGAGEAGRKYFEPILAKGGWGRMNTANKISKMNSIDSKTMGNWSRYMETSTSDTFRSKMAGYGASVADAEMPAFMADSTRLGIEGTVSGRWAGFVSGSRGMTEAGRGAMSEVGSTSFKAGFGTAERYGADIAARAGMDIAEKGVGRIAIGAAIREGGIKEGGLMAGKVAARTAGLAAADGPLPILDTVAAVWLAYDMAKLGASAIKGVGKLAGDAAKSASGDINKDPFTSPGASPWLNSEVAATSRMRGVQAIQNSRLNARSILGSEASGMWQHFG